MNKLTNIHPGVRGCQRGAHTPEQRPNRNLPLIVIVWLQEPALAGNERRVSFGKLARQISSPRPDFAARLRPDAALVWETRGAAPLVLAGAQLKAACDVNRRRPSCGQRAAVDRIPIADNAMK